MIQNQTSCVLMGRKSGPKYIGSMYGSMTDINVWDSYFTNDEIEDFQRCKEKVDGKILDWNYSDVKIEGYVLRDIEKISICIPIGREDSVIIGNKRRKRNFLQAKSFCEKAFGGRIGVTYDSSKMIGFINELKILEIEKGINTGFKRATKNGHTFLDIYDQLPLPNFPWYPDQPNNFGGNQDCVTFSLDGLLNDMECSTPDLATICQVRPKTVFQLDGLCEHLDVDTTYILSEV